MTGKLTLRLLAHAAWLGLFLSNSALPLASTTSETRTVLPPVGLDLADTRTPRRTSVLLSGDWTVVATPTDNPIRHEAKHPFRALYTHGPETTVPVQVQVPGVWQNQGLGMNYHDTALYLREFATPTRKLGERTWLHMERVATLTTVTLNGKPVGTHQGAWTPFAFDITDQLASTTNTLHVEVGEAGEHYTSGFIKNASNSFGGIWGDVWLENRHERFVQDVHAWADAATSGIKVRVQLGGRADAPGLILLAKLSDTSATLCSTQVSVTGASEPMEFTLPVSNVKYWEHGTPALYRLELELISKAGDNLDYYAYRTGFRHTTTTPDHLLVNGRPVYWASILHWGVYPKLLAPFNSREEFREEIKLLKECGFNAINVCLFMFPRRYYDICDEEGMMVWQEYPLWFYHTGTPRPATKEHKDLLVQEFREMFLKDQQHPSVILRSMACEDPQQDDEVMQRLVDLCHDMIPGSLAQDNTSFLDQKFADFFDMHPYEELEDYPRLMKQWVEKSKRLGAKPFLFGESLDNDTFRDFAAIESAGSNKPWWTEERFCRSLVVPASDGYYWRQKIAAQDITKAHDAGTLGKTVQRSNDRTYQARKYQVEQSRLYKVFAGLSITAIADTICSRPGIFDELNRLKWSPETLRVLNTPTMLIMNLSRHSRCYASGETATGTLHLSHFGREAIIDAVIDVVLSDSHGRAVAEQQIHLPSAEPGFVDQVAKIELTLPVLSSPEEYTLQASLQSRQVDCSNSWTLTLFPRQVNPGALVEGPPPNRPPDDKVYLVNDLTPEVYRSVERGASVLVCKARQSEYYKTRKGPFWREQAVLHFDPLLFMYFPWDGSMGFPFYGLGGIYAFEIPADETAYGYTSLLRTINCRHMTMNDLIVQKRIGKGSLVATTLDLQNPENPAGNWLMQMLVQRLQSSTTP